MSFLPQSYQVWGIHKKQCFSLDLWIESQRKPLYVCEGVCKDEQRSCEEEHLCHSRQHVRTSWYWHLWSERTTDDQVHVHGKVEEIVRVVSQLTTWDSWWSVSWPRGTVGGQPADRVGLVKLDEKYFRHRLESVELKGRLRDYVKVYIRNTLKVSYLMLQILISRVKTPEFTLCTVPGVPEKNAQSLAHDKFWTVRCKMKFFCTKMFGKDYCQPVNAKYV